ncbi:MAG: hypothetical protein Q7K34_00620, partial [archaeon]|nr:hypothetical protein [archaeon]
MKKWLLIGLLAIIFTFGCVQTTTQKLQDDIPSNMFQCQSGDFVSDLNLCPTEEIEPVEELNNQSMEEIEEQPEEPGPLEEAKFTVKFSRSGYGWEQIEQNGIKSNYRGD